MMANVPDSLAPMRREIDSIDESLHDLLMRRADIVGEIGRQKASDGGPTFRPAREAQLLRRLLARHEGALPKSFLVRLWREIVASSTRLQGSFSAGYCPIEGQGDALRLANSQFGLDANVVRFSSAVQVISAVGRGDVSVGIVPLPYNSNSPEWWEEMQNAPKVRIVARLPWFVSSADAEEGVGAFVVSTGEPEESGEDRSVLTFACGTDVSRARFAELARENKLASDTQAVALGPDQLCGRKHLVDVAGFVIEDDPRVRGLATLLGDAEVRFLGAYAAPFVDLSDV
ncbi:MAG: chorismate mutase [Alphaproteobacteria bacterium]|nr:chorismate mutase [Alphaproteobacteria bacterium]